MGVAGQLQTRAVIRVVEGSLAWYPPGANEEPQWLDDESAAQGLRAVLSRRSASVCLAVPGEDVRTLRLPVTADEKKHIGRSLPFMLEEQVAEDIENLHFAATPLDTGSFAVAIANREKMATWGEMLSSFPGVNQWVPEPLLLPWLPDEWCLVIEAGQAVVRTGPCEGFSAELSLLPVMLEGVLAGAEAPDSVIVYGRDQQADTAHLPESLRERVQWRDGGFCAALMLGDGGNPPVNLLQGQYAPQLPLGRWWRQWRMVAALFAVAFVLQLMATYADYRSQKQENLLLRGAVEQSYRKAYPRGVVVDPEKQLRRQLDAMRGSAQTSGFVSLMDKVGAVIAARPGTSIASINYNDKADEMRMNIIAEDFEAVEQVRSRINETGLDAVMESSSAQGDRVRARLRVGARS